MDASICLFFVGGIVDVTSSVAKNSSTSMGLVVYGDGDDDGEVSVLFPASMSPAVWSFLRRSTSKTSSSSSSSFSP